MTARSVAALVTALVVVGSVGGVVTGASAGGVAGATDGQSANAARENVTVLSSCTTITESGSYRLGEDVENSSADTCIRIRASDVTFDGGGHRIDGVADVDPEEAADRFFSGQENPFRSRTKVGVAVTADRSLSNVTVTNLTLTDWRWGAVANSVRAGRISDVRVEDTAFGVAAFESPGVDVTDVVAVENAVFGVGAFGGERTTVGSVTAIGNGVVGVYLASGRDATVSNVTARDNDVAGVLLDRTRNATVSAASASGSRFGVYLFETTDSEVTGATAVENGVAGVFLRGTTDASVTTTNASQSRYGIYLLFADDVSVTDSTANDGVMGVFVRNSSGATVVNNTVLDNSFDGVYLENSTGVRVADNRDGAVTVESRGNETIGAEGGYRHDSTIDVNQSDGLSAAERRAYVYRAIARAEYLRQLEYTGSLSLEVVSQKELNRRRAAEPADSGTTAAWENQLWEATFVVGEDRNSTQVVNNESSRVAGFYNSFADKMVIVSDDAPLTVSSTTLVHEFIHALQDQHFDLTRDQFQPRTEDVSRARSSLIEGDARYVEERFEQLCGVVWGCVQVESEEPPGGDVSPTRNFAVRQMILAPYSDGPQFVAQLRQQGGWAAVDDVYENPPNTTEQILHPDKRTEPPVPLAFEDTARAGWRPFDQSNLSFSGVGGTTTIGEVGIFTTFWYQGYEYDNEIVDVNEHLYPNDATFDWFNYTSAPSAGWGNDLLVPYRKATPDGSQFGYVWRTAWDTPKDARQFHEAYLAILRGHGAERVGQHTWRIESGPFADAFRVVRQDANVTIVNAPTVEALADVRPGLADEETTTEPETTTDEG